MTKPKDPSLLEQSGRPTKYKEEYCQGIIDFFDRPLMVVDDSGKQAPCIFPTMQRYASNLGVHIDTIHEWAKVHPEFSEALGIAKQYQEDILLQHGLGKRWDSAFCKFVAVNLTRMRDKVEHSVDDDTRKALTLAYKLD